MDMRPNLPSCVRGFWRPTLCGGSAPLMGDRPLPFHGLVAPPPIVDDGVVEIADQFAARVRLDAGVTDLGGRREHPQHEGPQSLTPPVPPFGGGLADNQPCPT